MRCERQPMIAWPQPSGTAFLPSAATGGSFASSAGGAGSRQDRDRDERSGRNIVRVARESPR